MNVVQASVFLPSIFIAQDPQIPSRQERLMERVLSTSFFILSNASKTIAPQSSKSIKKVSTVGLDCFFELALALGDQR